MNTTIRIKLRELIKEAANRICAPLSADRKIKIVVGCISLLVLFQLGSLIHLVYHMGKERGQTDVLHIQHIKSMPLPGPVESVNENRFNQKEEANENQD